MGKDRLRRPAPVASAPERAGMLALLAAPKGFRGVSDEIFGIFAEQILPFDTAAATEYAVVVSRCDALGLPIEGFDAQIAAICRARGAALATRNVTGFRGTGIEVINPWNTDR